MNEILKEILPISVLLTFIGTLITIYYTRRNIKTTKYIETITSERIKWIDIMRKEVSNIITNVYFTLNVYSEDIKDTEDHVYGSGDEQKQEAQSRLFDAKTTLALGQKKDIWSQSDFIWYLHVFKLKLNPKEDEKIIGIIDYFSKFYIESEYKTKKEIPEAKKKIKELVELTQDLLKNEWDKVKKESKGNI